MSHEIRVKVEGHEISLVDKDIELIEENTDYVLAFDLDSEWSGRTPLTAVFKYPSGNYIDKTLDASHKCSVPRISGTSRIIIGLYSKVSDTDFLSTTSIKIPVAESIVADRNEELSGSINKSTSEVLAQATTDLAALESTYNNIVNGKTAVIVDVTG